MKATNAAVKKTIDELSEALHAWESFFKTSRAMQAARGDGPFLPTDLQEAYMSGFLRGRFEQSLAEIDAFFSDPATVAEASRYDGPVDTSVEALGF